MLKALILEDTAAKLRRVSEVLLATRAIAAEDIDVAPDAVRARRYLSERRYDLLVLDLSVPETLGAATDPDAGRRVLDDLVEDERLLMPGQIVGLTGFEELAIGYRADFEARGVLLVQYGEASSAWEQPLVMSVRRLVASHAAELSGKRDYESALGVVCALDVELAAIERLPWGWREVQVPGDPTSYLEGSYTRHGVRRRVVAASCPRMGMSAASITTLKMIEAFRPEVVAMTGITAAVRDKADIGDVIVADECWDWGMGKWIRVKKKPVFVPGPHHIALDSDLRGIVTRMAREAERLARIRSSWPGEAPSASLKIVIGPVASGSAVIAAQEMSEHIQAQQRRLVGIEMEAYGLYAAASEARLPRPRAIALKAACDYADDQKGDKWRHYAAFTSAQTLRWMAEEEL